MVKVLKAAKNFPKKILKKFWLERKKRCIFAPALRASKRSEKHIEKLRETAGRGVI